MAVGRQVSLDQYTNIIDCLHIEAVVNIDGCQFLETERVTC